MSLPLPVITFSPLNRRTTSSSRKICCCYAPPADKTPAESLALPPGLRPELMPKHVAVIMDGNRRWAEQRGLAVFEGHKAGAQSLAKMANLCSDWGVKVLTAFAFSTENWKRSVVEVDLLMGLLQQMMDPRHREENRSQVKDDIRLSVIGDLLKLPSSLQKDIAAVEETTQANTGLHVLLAINYSGQQDIVQACKKVIEGVKINGIYQPEEISESLIAQNLHTSVAEFPNPDLLIRSSGELRISNFLMWQMVNTELYFVDKTWPDFGEEDLRLALSSFQHRQ